LLALLTHVLEIQFSMFVLPGEAAFWLIGGAAVGVRAPAVSARPVGRPGSPRAASRLAAPARWRTAAAWPLVAFTTAGVGAAALLWLAPPPSAPLLATIAACVPLLLAPFVGAWILSRAASVAPSTAAEPAVPAAVALAVLAVVSSLLLASHQLAALAADTAFQRAEAAQRVGLYAAAIPPTQEAIALAPTQAEYYHQLGQYYGALAGQTRGVARADPPLTLATALSFPTPSLLGREQLFALGQRSIEAAIGLNPFEVRYLISLAELQRYWSELDGRPTHLPAALANFARAAALKPNDVEIYAGIADSYLLSGDPAAAVDAALHANALLGSYWYPYSVLARAYLALGRPVEAYAAAQSGLEYASARFGPKPASPFELQRLQATAAAAEQAQLDAIP
jgi:tetratricopeptide (TPR) repeat protein